MTEPDLIYNLYGVPRHAPKVTPIRPPKFDRLLVRFAPAILVAALLLVALAAWMQVQ